MDKFMKHTQLMKGLNTFLQERAYNVASQDELWVYLEKENKTGDGILDKSTWLSTGYNHQKLCVKQEMSH